MSDDNREEVSGKKECEEIGEEGRSEGRRNPLLAWLQTSCGQDSRHEGKLRAQLEADERREEGRLEGGRGQQGRKESGLTAVILAI